MADQQTAAPSVMDQWLGNLSRLGDVYSKVTLAQKGVATPIAYETKSAGAPLVQQGQPAAVAGNDPLADAINNVTNKAALAYTAKQVNDSMPYIVGLVALGITIYLLTK